MKSRRQSRISASPLLVGAVTTVVIIVGVFFSYNANSGLPFVPTYQVNVELPSAQSLVQGNEVRIAGVRVGILKTVTAQQKENGETVARLQLQLDKSVQPIPDNSTISVRQRSALGLKYLLLNPGNSDKGLPVGGTLGPSQVTPEAVDGDQVFNMFQEPVRRAIQVNLAEYGGFFAGRGGAINEILGQLPPLLEVAQPVAKNLASDKTDIEGFVRGLSQAAAEVAPVADTQAELFVNLDTTFTALAEVARPFMQDSISEAVPAQLAIQRNASDIQAFLYASSRFARALKPGADALGKSAPIVNDSLDVGIPVLRSTPQLYNELAPTARSLRNFGEDTGVNNGLDSLIKTNKILQPLLSHVAPAQNVCNYLALLLSNAQEVTSFGTPEGRWTRAISVLPPVGPNSESGPASAPASGGGTDIRNFLHSNPYPYTASPGQPRVCAAGNEIYSINPRQTVIGNQEASNTVVTQNQSQAQLEWGLKK